MLKRRDVSLLFTGKKVGERAFVFPPTLIPQYLRLLEKLEVALPLSSTELLIPSRWVHCFKSKKPFTLL